MPDPDDDCLTYDAMDEMWLEDCIEQQIEDDEKERQIEEQS